MHARIPAEVQSIQERIGLRQSLFWPMVLNGAPATISTLDQGQPSYPSDPRGGRWAAARVPATATSSSIEEGVFASNLMPYPSPAGLEFAGRQCLVAAFLDGQDFPLVRCRPLEKASRQ